MQECQVNAVGQYVNYSCMLNNRDILCYNFFGNQPYHNGTNIILLLINFIKLFHKIDRLIPFEQTDYYYKLSTLGCKLVIS
jgi:hypothetical protein